MSEDHPLRSVYDKAEFEDLYANRSHVLGLLLSGRLNRFSRMNKGAFL